MIHVRKVLPEYFNALQEGTKRFELRREDPDAPRFAVGDYLALNEYDPGRHAALEDLYTGRCLLFEIGYVLRNYDGLEEDYVILGLKTTPLSWMTNGELIIQPKV